MSYFIVWNWGLEHEYRAMATFDTSGAAEDLADALKQDEDHNFVIVGCKNGQYEVASDPFGVVCEELADCETEA